MGTSCRQSASGRWVLDCATCGRAGEVRKRRCPADYCYPAQLCGPCFAEERASGAWRAHHAGCAAGHAAYIAEQAAKDAEPDHYAAAAWGQWHSQVPAGMVTVMTRAGTWVMMPHADYLVGARLPASAVPAEPITSGV